MRSIPKLLTILLPILVIPINLFASNEALAGERELSSVPNLIYRPDQGRQVNKEIYIITQQDVIVSASSTLNDSPQYSPSNLLDPKPPEESDLNWCEGKGDAGICEWVYFKFKKPTPIFSITVYNGFWKQPFGGDNYWSSNNRVKVMDVFIDDGDQFQANLDNDFVCNDYEYCSVSSKIACGSPGNDNCIPFPTPQKPISGFKLMIKDIYRGEKWNDTCLHHIEILKWTPKIQLDDAIRAFLFPHTFLFDHNTYLFASGDAPPPRDLRKLFRLIFRLIRELKLDPNVVFRDGYYGPEPGPDARPVFPIETLLYMTDRSLIEIATAGGLRITKDEVIGITRAEYADIGFRSAEHNRILGQWIYEVCRITGISITVMRNELNATIEELEAKESQKSSDGADDFAQKAAKSYLQSWKNIRAGFVESIQKPKKK